METVSITDRVIKCFDSFNLVSPDSKISDELARFRIWAGNIGAHRKGSSSLDYRLRDASHIKSQVVDLLDDLDHALTDAKLILDGEKVPWDKVVEDEHLDESDDELNELLKGGNGEFDTELSQIYADIAEVIDCLYRLSMSIRNPAPHERFRLGHEMLDTSVFEMFDINHVQTKFPFAAKEVASRLGKANSRRRQYFRYRESHHVKLSRGLDFNSARTEAGVSTIASSIPKAMKGAHDLGRLDEDAESIGGYTQTSYATSASGSEKLRVPPLPKKVGEGPFECPFCYMIISASSTLVWRKHVFADLQPYICLEPNCNSSSQQFSRRHDWMEHVVQHHWRAWECTLCSLSRFVSSTELENHLARQHKLPKNQGQLDVLINEGARMKPLNCSETCPLCKETLDNANTYKRHVGRHQEELALFTLPASNNDDGPYEDDGSISILSETNNDSVSNSIQDDGEAQQLSHTDEDGKLLGENLSQVHQSTFLDEDTSLIQSRAANPMSLPGALPSDEQSLKSNNSVFRGVEISYNFRNSSADGAFADSRTSDHYLEKYLTHEPEEEHERMTKGAVEKYESEEAAQEAREKAEKEEADREYMHILRQELLKHGVDEDSVAIIMTRKNLEKEKKEQNSQHQHDVGPVYTRMSRRHLSLETLREYNVDYQLDSDPDYVLIKRWVPEDEQDKFWGHTRIVREERSRNLTTPVGKVPKKGSTLQLPNQGN